MKLISRSTCLAIAIKLPPNWKRNVCCLIKGLRRCRVFNLWSKNIATIFYCRDRKFEKSCIFNKVKILSPAMYARPPQQKRPSYAFLNVCLLFWADFFKTSARPNYLDSFQLWEIFCLLLPFSLSPHSFPSPHFNLFFLSF